MISVVIPTLNEARCLSETLSVLIAAATRELEIIIVDGGSVDDTVTIAQSFGVRVVTCVVTCAGGRAKQMNAGAAIANGEILMFLHGDTQVPKAFDVWVNEFDLPQSKSSVIACAFNLKINSDRKLLRLVEWGVSFRSRIFQLPYGDQALFLKTSTFHKFGGFPELPIMEDFVLIRTLARHGKIAIVPAAVTTSARRWEKQGILKTTCINQLMILGYYFGISPDRLRLWYRSGLTKSSTKSSTKSKKPTM
jgi:rSAM/selenodomain-associated transferase 2